MRQLPDQLRMIFQTPGVEPETGRERSARDRERIRRRPAGGVDLERVVVAEYGGGKRHWIERDRRGRDAERVRLRAARAEGKPITPAGGQTSTTGASITDRGILLSGGQSFLILPNAQPLL